MRRRLEREAFQSVLPDFAQGASGSSSPDAAPGQALGLERLKVRAHIGKDKEMPDVRVPAERGA